MKTDRNSNFYKKLLDNLYDGVYFVDRDRRITYWNKGAERFTGYATTEVLGTHCSDDILMHVDDKGTILCKGKCPLSETMSDGIERESEVYFHHKEGHRVPVSIRVTPVRGSGGEIVGAVEIFSDNSSRVSALQRIEELQRLAMLDPLTELANRRYIEIILGVHLEELRRYGWPFGIIFIDIDHFKKINDTYGHELGDRILKMVSKTLSNGLRSVDFIGRWGGEEFIAIVVNIKKEQLVEAAERLRLLTEQSSITTGTQTIQVTISAGAAVAEAGETMKTLLKRADRLMYKSKALGRNCVSISFDE